MTKKLKLKLLILLSVVAAAALSLFAGCKLGTSLEEILEKNNLTARVTYYANGGMFNDNSSTKNIYYKAGSRILNIVEETSLLSGTANVTRKDYSFVGWYYVEYANGEIVYEDEAKTVFAGEREVDFTKPIEEGEELAVFAKWSANVKIRVILATEKPFEFKGTSYNTGDEITTFSFYGDSVQLDTYTPAPFGSELTGTTFVNYYSDESCTQLITEPIQKQEEDVRIYAKFIDGDWTVLRDSNDVIKNWLRFGLAGNYYLSNDIDCNGKTLGNPLSMFACTLQGNGFKISNFVVNRSNIANSSSAGMFGTVKAGAKLIDVVFDNFTVTYSVRSNANVNLYLFAEAVESGAQISGVHLNGNLKIAKPASSMIANIQNLGDDENENYETDNWLCGAYSTDAEFLAAFGGITVSDESSFEITK